MQYAVLSSNSFCWLYRYSMNTSAFDTHKKRTSRVVMHTSKALDLLSACSGKFNGFQPLMLVFCRISNKWDKRCMFFKCLPAIESILKQRPICDIDVMPDEFPQMVVFLKKVDEPQTEKLVINTQIYELFIFKTK